VRGRGADALAQLLDDPLADETRAAAWRNLPILDEWRRLFPERDPVEVHARVFRERLVAPGGGEYVWNAEWSAMESTVHGHPGAPADAAGLPPAWRGFGALRSDLTFEHDGLRVRLALDRD
jgi:hypothetical protein